MRSNLLLACVLAMVHTVCIAQDVLTRDNVSTWQPTWRFQQGDDPAWSKTDFDDHTWATPGKTLLEPGPVDSTHWRGIGWFRARFSVDSTLSGVPLAYTVVLGGAAEIYLDGVLIDRLGRPAASVDEEHSVRYTPPRPRSGLVASLEPGGHVLALRVSNIFLSQQGETAFGFRMQFGQIKTITSRLVGRARLQAAKSSLLPAVAAVLALIYLLLYAFQPKQLKSLLFSVLAGLTAFVVFANQHSRIVVDPEAYLWWRRYMEIAGAIAWVAAVRFIGMSFFKETWKLFSVLVALTCLVTVYVYFDPIGGFWSLVVLSVLATIELLRRTGLAVFLSRSGAGIVASGLVLLILCTVYDYAVGHRWIHPFFNVTGLLDFGLIGALVSMATLITSDFVRANRALELKVAQVHREAEKALQDEKVNQGLRIERIQSELDKRRKEFEQAKAREVDAIRKTLVVAEEHQKEMKNRLIRVERNSLLGKLAGGIAHDVDDLLKGMGHLTTLSQDLTSELEQVIAPEGGKGPSADLLRQLRINLERIHEQGDIAEGVMDDILRHSADAPNEPKRVDVNQLVDRYLNLSLHAAHGEFPGLELAVERVFDERTGEIDLRAASLGRALIGIFRNAVEVLAEYAAKTKDDFQPTLTVSTQRLENAILIRIRDNGPGVAQDLRDRIFEPFVTTSQDKAGLGLSIAQQMIVGELDGTFGLEHFKEQGAGFYITIPLQKEAPSQTEGVESSE